VFINCEMKMMKHYRVFVFILKYDILIINGNEHFIRLVDEKNKVLCRYYDKIDKLFNILHETHSAIRHGGGNRMITEK